MSTEKDRNNTDLIYLKWNYFRISRKNYFMDGFVKNKI